MHRSRVLKEKKGFGPNTNKQRKEGNALRSGHSDQMSSSSSQDVREVQVNCCPMRYYPMGSAASNGFNQLSHSRNVVSHLQQSQRKEGGLERGKDRGALSGHFKHFGV